MGKRSIEVDNLGGFSGPEASRESEKHETVGRKKIKLHPPGKGRRTGPWKLLLVIFLPLRGTQNELLY